MLASNIVIKSLWWSPLTANLRAFIPVSEGASRSKSKNATYVRLLVGYWFPVREREKMTIVFWVGDADLLKSKLSVTSKSLLVILRPIWRMRARLRIPYIEKHLSWLGAELFTETPDVAQVPNRAHTCPAYVTARSSVATASAAW